MDYQSNSRKAKEELPDKKIEKVVVGTVIVQKKSLIRRFRGLFVAADAKSVFGYVVADKLIPAVRNMIVDASIAGIERMIYGDRAIHHRNYGHGPRITYNNPINRSQPYRNPTRTAPVVDIGSRRSHRQDSGVYILSSREEADLVLERMIDIIEHYEVVSVADLNELIGQPSTHVDNRWGWLYLSDVPVRQVREGFLLDLPDAEPIK